MACNMRVGRKSNGGDEGVVEEPKDEEEKKEASVQYRSSDVLQYATEYSTQLGVRADRAWTTPLESTQSLQSYACLYSVLEDPALKAVYRSGIKGFQF